MAETKQHQGPVGLPSNTTRNESQAPPLLDRLGDQTPTNQSAPLKATGQRTAQGKKRTRFNALKHGLLSKFVLLVGESEDEYRSLLFGLQDYFQPQGKLESVLVEKLAILLWRTRRIIKAENAEISGKMFFIETELRRKETADALQLSRDAVASDGLVAHDDNLFVVEEIISTCEKLRQLVTGGEVSESISFIDKLYGVNQYGKTPDPFRHAFEKYVEAVKLGKAKGDPAKLAEMKQMMIEMINDEIARFSTLMELREEIAHKKVLFKELAGVIPSGGASDLLLRYEAHLSRETDRTLNQLERLQRMRQGQPLPPQVDVKIS